MASRSASPNRFNANTVNKIDTLGKTVSHQASRMFSKPSRIMLPQVAAGGGTPRPMKLSDASVRIAAAILHVPFKGTGEAMHALLGGEVDMTFSSTGSAMPHVRGHKLTAIAVCSPQRLPQLPDVPAISETLKGYELMTWYGIAGPANLPAGIVARMEVALQTVLTQPDVVKKLDELDAQVQPGTASGFRQFWNAEVARYQKLITDNRIKA